ncbi:hypothetical protein BSKO_01569 [Bryopsis sp. KO-2023]|nr:hypothetical protein BSKO_01569 [Bryopsis sp. KO-2023]
MDVRPVTRTGVVASEQLAPGALGWATVEELVNKNSSNARAVTQVANELYTSTRKGIRKWSLTDGSSEAVIEAESFSSMVHALLVVESDLWACLGDGHIAIYDVETRFPKRKPFRGHNGEILCVTQGIPNRTVITGGADFQVKVWNREGEILSTSGHHHGAVECVLALQHPIFTVYTGSADGSVFRFQPNALDGKLDDGSGAPLRAESQAGDTMKLRTKAHSSRIATATKVGSQFDRDKKDLLAQLEASRDSLQTAADETQKELLQAEGKFNGVMQANTELNMKLERLAGVENQLREVQQEKHALQISADQMKNDYEKHAQEQLTRMSQAETGHERNQNYLTHELQKQREQLEAVMREAADLRERAAASHQQSSEKLEILSRDLERTVAEKFEAESAASSLKEQLLDFQATRGADLGQLHANVENLKNLLQASESEKAAVTEDMYQLKQTLQARNEDFKQIQAEQERDAQIGLLAKDNAALNESLQKHSSLVANLKKDLSSRDIEFRGLHDEIERMKRQLDTKVEEHKVLQSNYKALEDQTREEAGRMAKEKEDLETQVTSLKKLKDDLNNEILEDKEKSQKGHQSLKAEFEAAERKSKASAQTILQVESQLSAARGEQEKIRGERDKALEDLNKAHLEARHIQRNAELREKENARLEEELRKAKESCDDALAKMKAIEEKNLRRESEAPSSKEEKQLIQQLEHLKLVKDKADASLQEKERKILELTSQAAQLEEKATKAGVDVGEATIREKELLLEVERLRTRCRDGDVRMAALLQDLHRFQQELMLHQDKSQQAKEEVESAKELAETCQKSSSAAEAKIEKLRSKYESEIEGLKKRVEEADANKNAASKIKMERDEDWARWKAEEEGRRREISAYQESNARLQHQVRLLEGEVARQSGVIQETRAGVEKQQQGFYQESRRLTETVHRIQVENEALKRENMQLQVELHSYEHRLSHAPTPEVAHRLQEVEIALKQAISDYHMVLQELAKIREETVWKDQKLRELEASNCQLASELDYFKCEHHRVDALVGVMESRATQLRQGEVQEVSVAGLGVERGDEAGRPGQQRKRDKERWIPPTGLG